MVFCHSVVLPDEMQFLNRIIYGTDSIEVGAYSVINELVAEQDIVLNCGSCVNTLLYGGNTITVHADCILKYYTKSNHKICFEGKTAFQYLHAPRIEFGIFP